MFDVIVYKPLKSTDGNYICPMCNSTIKFTTILHSYDFSTETIKPTRCNYCDCVFDWQDESTRLFL